MRVIIVDVGTHLGQELRVLYGSKFFLYYRLFRRHIKNLLFNFRFDLALHREILKNVKLVKKYKSKTKIVAIEPNIKVINSSIYKSVDVVLPGALCDDITAKTIIGKLFLKDGREDGQGSSLFLSEQESNFIPIFTIPIRKFCEFIRDEYQFDIVVVRLNCEGSEDDIIYEFRKAFGTKFNLVLGSLKDVKEYKGENAYRELEDFMAQNHIVFCEFHNQIDTWPLALRSLSEKYEVSV